MIKNIYKGPITYTRCIKCDKFISEDSIFCSYCGTKQQLKCPKCGATFNGDCLYCNQCGTKLSETDEQK